MQEETWEGEAQDENNNNGVWERGKRKRETAERAAPRLDSQSEGERRSAWIWQGVLDLARKRRIQCLSSPLLASPHLPSSSLLSSPLLSSPLRSSPLLSSPRKTGRHRSARSAYSLERGGKVEGRRGEGDEGAERGKEGERSGGRGGGGKDGTGAVGGGRHKTKITIMVFGSGGETAERDRRARSA